MSQERNSALSQSVRATQRRLVTMVVLIGEALEFLYQMPIYRLQGANYIFFKMRDFDNSKKSRALITFSYNRRIAKFTFQ